MSVATRSAITLILALVLALVALVVVATPQGSDDARRKITMSQVPAVSQTVDAPAGLAL